MMTVGQIIELLQMLDPSARVLIASPDGITFHALREVDGDSPDEAVFWPEAVPLAEEDEPPPPGTTTH